MVIRFAPNKNDNQKVVKEQAVWRGTNFYVKISLINLKVSAICTVQLVSNLHGSTSFSNLHGSLML